MKVGLDGRSGPPARGVWPVTFVSFSLHVSAPRGGGGALVCEPSRPLNQRLCIGGMQVCRAGLPMTCEVIAPARGAA